MRKQIGLAFLAMSILAVAACGGSGGTTVPQPPTLAAYTLSYRSGVRVPAANAALTFDGFVSQVSRLDPISAIRCPVTRDAEYQAAADALGGITWTHPVEILKDRSLPPLYRGQIPPPKPSPIDKTYSEGAADRAPTIERPDLVGYEENTAIFLSQRHGLLAVRTDMPRPVLSCALKLPGNAKFFFYHGKELVLLVNGLRVDQAALLRFGVTATGFEFIDALRLENQQILDARLFDRTLIVYSALVDPPVTSTPPSGAVESGGTGSKSAGGIMSDAPSSPSLPISGASIGVKLTAAKWTSEPLTVAWSESFLNDRPVNDPFASAGMNPIDAAAKLQLGDIVGTRRGYKSFISASDRYVVVSRDVDRTVFTGTRTEVYPYCAASHPGPERSVTYCSPKYEQRKNPDYREGDYACDGKTLLACIQEAAPTVSRYLYVRVGESCQAYTYHDVICDRFETNTVSYPTYRTDRSTQFVVYRYVDGDFVKLDEQLFQMAPPDKTTGSVSALSFTGKPLEVAGSIDHKGDLQFQHGHFYVLTDQGQTLHTLILSGNSIAEIGVQAMPRRGSYSFRYSGSHSTLFSAERMMVSRAFYDWDRPQNISIWSDVLMLDLAAPSFPAIVNQYVMPGSSDQLILANAGVLGPGSVSFDSGGVARNLQKLTLFDPTNAAEKDNLLLGTEFDSNFARTWLGTADDQRIRLDGGSQRLFLPYGGYHHRPAEVFNPAAHRLNITAVGVGTGLQSEVTFDLVEDIVRTVSLDSSPSSGRALAFGDSSVYALNQGPQGWSLDVIQEYATPLAVYRLSDQDDVHARIDRIGAHCQISTFRGSMHAFDAVPLAVGPKIECTESGSPIAVGLNVVFSPSTTGWRFSGDGLTITALAAAEVAEALELVRNDVYCAIDGTKADGMPVDFLDEVPASVQCFVHGSGMEVEPPR